MTAINGESLRRRKHADEAVVSLCREESLFKLMTLEGNRFV